MKNVLFYCFLPLLEFLLLLVANPLSAKECDAIFFVGEMIHATEINSIKTSSVDLSKVMCAAGYGCYTTLRNESIDNIIKKFVLFNRWVGKTTDSSIGNAMIPNSHDQYFTYNKITDKKSLNPPLTANQFSCLSERDNSDKNLITLMSIGYMKLISGEWKKFISEVSTRLLAERRSCTSAMVHFNCNWSSNISEINYKRSSREWLERLTFAQNGIDIPDCNPRIKYKFMSLPFVLPKGISASEVNNAQSSYRVMNHPPGACGSKFRLKISK